MTELKNLDLSQDANARRVVKDETVSVEFAAAEGELMSLEGPNRYARGDALITGVDGRPLGRLARTLRREVRSRRRGRLARRSRARTATAPPSCSPKQMPKRSRSPARQTAATCCRRRRRLGHAIRAGRLRRGEGRPLREGLPARRLTTPVLRRNRRPFDLDGDIARHGFAVRIRFLERAELASTYARSTA